MIKVLQNEIVRKIDRATILKEGITSVDLMDRAAKACTEWITENIPAGFSFLILCGSGNNGGDGIAIARLLWQKGKIVDVFRINGTGNATDDFKTQQERWELLTGKNLSLINGPDDLPEVGSSVIIIDAIFGSGLNCTPDGNVREIIEKVNTIPASILSIDIPSGLFSDVVTEQTKSVIRAQTTLCLQIPRQSFFYPEYEPFTGNWIVIDIGLDPDEISKAGAKAFVPEHNDITFLQPQRPIFGHKGTFGHALLLCGSYGKAGAAILAANACLRSGAGLVTIRTPSLCVEAVQTIAPEAMCSPDSEPTYLTEIVKPEKFNSIGAGPGIGTDKQTGNVIKRILQDFEGPLVLDADAINLIADNPTWLSFLPTGTILTPHPGEFARLFGKINDPFARTEKQLEMAQRFNCYIILKGKFTSIACPDGQLYFNPTGNNGLAKGGSGDVLTGLITGLLAAGHSPMTAAITGVYVHGLAGDICSRENHPLSMTAGDLALYFTNAFREINESMI